MTHGKKTNFSIANVLECSGTVTSDRLLWRKDLVRHCMHLYFDPNEDEAKQRRRVLEWRSVALNQQRDGIFAPHWTFGRTMFLLSRLRRPKAAAGGNILVAEILHALPWDMLLLIHEAFVTATLAAT